MNELKTTAEYAAKTAKSAVNDPLKSQTFPRPNRDAILVCPLGGVGSIGMNWTLYGYDGRWLLVDAGTGFAPRDLDFVDAIMPDPAALKSILPLLAGLVVTHAHEDHIGAIHRLWPTIRCPIYATPFASEVISKRLEEAGTREQVTLKTFNAGNTLKVGSFNIRTIRMTHSVPECVSLAINTAIGTVLHTGDWKLDPHPLIGKPTDLATLKSLGSSGVLAMVCDSTNADREGTQTSERDVAVGLSRAFAKIRGMAVVSCFSTNVARLASAAAAAKATGRQIALGGMSLIRNEEAARKVGLLPPSPQFLSETRHLQGLDRREMALVCTGAQGEANAALSKLSLGTNWRLPDLQPGDAVIHSARVIPGNENDLDVVFSRLREQGIQILSGDFEGKPLHVTGHAVAGEIRQMYAMVKPRFSIPVHGEARHLAAHADIALNSGVEGIIEPETGAVYAVSRSGVRTVAKVDVGLVAEMVSEDWGQRGEFVPWDSANPDAVLAYRQEHAAMVA